MSCSLTLIKLAGSFAAIGLSNLFLNLPIALLPPSGLLNPFTGDVIVIIRDGVAGADDGKSAMQAAFRSNSSLSSKTLTWLKEATFFDNSSKSLLLLLLLLLF